MQLMNINKTYHCENNYDIDVWQRQLWRHKATFCPDATCFQWMLETVYVLEEKYHEI